MKQIHIKTDVGALVCGPYGVSEPHMGLPPKLGGWLYPMVLPRPKKKVVERYTTTLTLLESPLFDMESKRAKRSETILVTRRRRQR